MKVSQQKFPKEVTKLGNSDLFNYATNKQYKNEKQLNSQELSTWSRLVRHDLDNAALGVPLNGFEEMIQLTEEGKMWKYPIDNEYGLDEGKQVPFEEHVFLEKHLEDFPKNEYIQTFMGFIVAGLAKNPWMTGERKVKAIQFYKEHFETKREQYKQTGFEI